MLHFIRKQFYLLRIFLAGLLALNGKSLTKVVRKIDREHFSKNATIAAYKHSWFRSIVRSVHFHPFKSVILVFCFYIIVAFILFILINHFHPLLNKDLNDTLFNAVIGLLSAQAALVAIVYPLVIALVGILFEIRSTNGSRFSILLHETEALPTGISALLLCAVFALELFIIPNLLTASVLALTILNCLWFVFNIFAFGFFLTHVFKFIHPRTRRNMLYRYIVNVAWPIQRKKVIMRDNIINAINYRYIGTKYNKNYEEKVLIKVAENLSCPPEEKNSHSVSIYLHRVRNISNIKFSVLNVVANSWMLPALKHADAEKIPTLVFSGSTSYKNEAQLAVSYHSPINLAQKFLTKLTYNFCSSIPQSAPPTMFEILNEQIGELIFLVESDRFQAFHDQMNQVIELHLFLFKISEATLGNKKFSYTQMQMLYPFDNTTVYTVGEKWGAAYHDLFKRVVNVLPKETEFFTHCAYLGYNLYTKALPVVSSSALGSINSIAFSLFLRLSKWGFLTYKSETGITGNPGILFELTPQKNEIYATAWRDFVGGWEEVLTKVPLAFTIEHIKNDEQKWQELVNHSHFLQQHLLNTAKIIIFSVWRGDYLAINWAADILVRWNSIVENNWLANSTNQNIPSALFTAQLLEKSWPEFKAGLMEKYPTVTIEIVLSHILKNLWSDVQIILICLISHWIKQYGTTGAAATATKNILNHVVFDNASIKYTQPITFKDAFISILRFYENPNYLHSFIDLAIEQKNMDQSIVVGSQCPLDGINNIYETLYTYATLTLVALMPQDTAIYLPEIENLLTSFNCSNNENLTASLNKMIDNIQRLDDSVSNILMVFNNGKEEDINFAQKKLNAVNFIKHCLK